MEGLPMDLILKIYGIPEYSISEFLKKYKKEWVNYCEIIILQTGNIVLAQPSHTEMLLRLTGQNKKDIWNIMSIKASPVHWLIYHTKCVSVWEQFQLLPEDITIEQMQTLETLIKEKMIIKKFGYVLEKEYILNQGDKDGNQEN